MPSWTLVSFVVELGLCSGMLLAVPALAAQTTTHQTVRRHRVVEADPLFPPELTQAEAAIEKAKGEASAQREQAQSITPEYLQLKWIEKWNGALPSTVTGDNALLNLPIGK